MKTADYINDLINAENGFASFYVEYFCDICAGYICDIIADLADRSVDICTQNLIDYVVDNRDSVDDAISDGIALDGFDYFSSHKDAMYIDYLEYLGSATQFYVAQNVMDEFLSQCIAASITSCLIDDIGEEIIDSQIDIIEKHAKAADIDDMIEDIVEQCREELFDN